MCAIIFSRLTFERAVIWSLFGAYLLLPSSLEIDAPFLPPLDKMAIAGLSTLLFCWMYGGGAPPTKRSIGLFLIGAIFVVSPILTSINNSYELRTAAMSLPGFYPLVALKFAGRNFLMLVPLYIGFRYLNTDWARAELLKFLPGAMLIYSLPMLFEIRMSPQLHRWVYGYFPHESFAQQIRDGGFRPVVFLSHGLPLALLTCVALLAALVLFRRREKLFHIPAAFVSAYLAGLLVLCKTLGAMIYAALLAPVVLLTKPRFWVKISCAFALLVCAYPLLRAKGLAPIDLVTEVANSVSADRAASFQIRVVNEDQLLAKANEKPLLGWGGWGRNRIYDEWTGQDISVTDGAWIIQYGSYGWVGYLSLIGLLAWSLFLALRLTGPDTTAVNVNRGALALLVGIYLLDSIPNSTHLAVVFVIAGSIAAAPLAARRRVRAPQSPLSVTASPAHNSHSLISELEAH